MDRSSLGQQQHGGSVFSKGEGTWSIGPLGTQVACSHVTHGC